MSLLSTATIGEARELNLKSYPFHKASEANDVLYSGCIKRFEDVFGNLKNQLTVIDAWKRAFEIEQNLMNNGKPSLLSSTFVKQQMSRMNAIATEAQNLVDTTAAIHQFLLANPIPFANTVDQTKTNTLAQKLREISTLNSDIQTRTPKAHYAGSKLLPQLSANATVSHTSFPAEVAQITPNSYGLEKAWDAYQTSYKTCKNLCDNHVKRLDSQATKIGQCTNIWRRYQLLIQKQAAEIEPNTPAAKMIHDQVQAEMAKMGTILKGAKDLVSTITKIVNFLETNPIPKIGTPVVTDEQLQNWTTELKKKLRGMEVFYQDLKMNINEAKIAGSNLCSTLQPNTSSWLAYLGWSSSPEPEIKTASPLLTEVPIDSSPLHIPTFEVVQVPSREIEENRRPSAHTGSKNNSTQTIPQRSYVDVVRRSAIAPHR